MNGNVVDAIGGIHKTVLCSSLCMFVCSTVTVVTVQSIWKKEAEDRQNPAESSGSPPEEATDANQCKTRLAMWSI